jgi:hypothetical protein
LPDAQRFLMVKEAASADADFTPTSLVVVQHFDQELKRLVPTPHRDTRSATRLPFARSVSRGSYP